MSRAAHGSDDSAIAELAPVATQLARKRADQFNLQRNEAEAYVKLMKNDRFWTHIGNVIVDGYQPLTHHILAGGVEILINNLDLRGLTGSDHATEPSALLFDDGRPPLWWIQPCQVLLAFVEDGQHITLTAFTRQADGGLHAVCSDAQLAVDTRQVCAALRADSLAELVAALGGVLAATLRAVVPSLPATITQAMVVLCPALYSCPLQLVRTDDAQRLMERFELVFCPSIVFLELIADQFNPRVPQRSTADAPSVTIGHSVEYEDSGPLHHLQAEIACVENRVHRAAGGLTVERVTTPQQLDRLNMQSRVPAVLSLHCHGTSDSFSPDDNRLVLQSEGAGNRFAQRERQEEQIFVKLYAALRSALTSFRWTTTNARPGEFFSWMENAVLHAGGSTREQRYLSALWTDRKDVVCARIYRCFEFHLEPGDVLLAGFQELYSPENLTASDVLQYVRLRGCQLTCLWACRSGLLEHDPTHLRQLVQLPELVHRLHLHDKPDVTKHIVHHLPISLLMAGCNAVISHQWNVTDACSVLLVDHFFELLLAGQLPISRCLQQAQHFLRDLTMGQMRKIERTMRRAAVPITIILPSECQGRDRPFENAKFWGGYQLTGTAQAFTPFRAP